MSLTNALNNALTGLNVNQRTIAVISNNIANANTEGYSRQIVNLESVTHAGGDSGVRIADVTRSVDKFLQVSVYNQTSEVGRSEVITDYYDEIQVLLGDPSLGNSIDNHIETFFNDLQITADTPERSSTRAAVIQSASVAAREISVLAQSLEELRFQVDNEIKQDTGALNQRLEELFFTNEAIAEGHSFGAPTATLLDQRDALAEEVAQYIDIFVSEKEDGSLTLSTGNGLNLVDFGYGQIEYREISSVDTLIEDGDINPLVLQTIDENGRAVSRSVNIASGGRSSQIEKRFEGGSLAGLLEIRDDLIPNILDQLDQLAAQLRDSFNDIHNQGSGYPPATELVGTAEFNVSERSLWEGSVTIAALNEDGTPAPSTFNDEVSGFRPLTINFSELFNSQGPGEVDLQTIINEVNHHFGVPQNRLQVGNINNIELAIVNDSLPGAVPGIEFDFEIENISGENAEFWVDGLQVLDETGADITSTTNTVQTVALSASNTFITSAASNVVTVTTDSSHSLSDGDVIRLDDPGIVIDGIPSAEFDGYFTISNVTGSTFEITVTTPAGAGASTDVAGQSYSPPYDTIQGGEQRRLQQNGTFSADLSGNSDSAYYDINVDIVTRDESGNLSTSTVTYRVLNEQNDTENDRIAARAVTAGSGVLTVPSTFEPLLRASLVDENGVELPSVSGDYLQQEGFLKIESAREGITLAIDDTSSSHLGLPNDNPPRPGDNRSFSHHFGLNNFFENNSLTPSGDSIKNSAINLAVEDRFFENSGLISVGDLNLSNQPVNSDADPLYTLERFSGDHSVIQRLARLGIESQEFGAAGGLPDTTLTFDGYAGELLGHIAANSITADRNAENDVTLLQGYEERADAVSGVNLDEELANTIVYQNAYAASARVISVTDELFDALLQSV